jgi:hypothetical protein
MIASDDFIWLCFEKQAQLLSWYLKQVSMCQRKCQTTVHVPVYINKTNAWTMRIWSTSMPMCLLNVFCHVYLYYSIQVIHSFTCLMNGKLLTHQRVFLYFFFKSHESIIHESRGILPHNVNFFRDDVTLLLEEVG